MAAPRLKVSSDTVSGIERRQLPRVDVRQSDGITCTVKSDGHVLYVGAPYDVSLASMAFLLNDDELARFLEFDKYEFQLELPEQGTFVFLGTQVALVRRDDGRTKLAFKFENPILAGLEKAEPIVETGSLVFPPNYSINSFIYKPNFFYERAFVRLVKLGSGTVDLELYDLEVLLFSGMEISLFMFEASSQLPPVKIRLDSIRKLEGKLQVTAQIVDFPKKVAARVAECLIFDLQMSIDFVKSLSLPVPRISDGLKFRFVKTTEEYQEVLELRFKAYQKAGKVADGKTAADMAAPLDHISRIMAVYHGKKIISSVAISFPEPDTKLDTERAFPNGYPKKMPAREKSIEISRLCTDPEYRGSDLLLRVFEHTYKTLQCAGRKYIITSTDAKLWPLYKKMGFLKTGMVYPHPYLSGIDHFVLVASATKPQNGVGIGALRWNYLYRDMNDFLIRRKVIKLSAAAKMWTGFYKWIGRVLKIKTKNPF